MRLGTLVVKMCLRASGRRGNVDAELDGAPEQKEDPERQLANAGKHHFPAATSNLSLLKLHKESHHHLSKGSLPSP